MIRFYLVQAVALVLVLPARVVEVVGIGLYNAAQWWQGLVWTMVLRIISGKPVTWVTKDRPLPPGPRAGR